MSTCLRWTLNLVLDANYYRSYDASAHLAEETHDASETVAKGMWAATLCAWVLSVPVSHHPPPHTQSAGQNQI